jgi:hypothetical protein
MANHVMAGLVPAIHVFGAQVSHFPVMPGLVPGIH